MHTSQAGPHALPALITITQAASYLSTQPATSQYCEDSWRISALVFIELPGPCPCSFTRALVRDRNGWLLTLIFSFSQGLVLCWQSSMVINLTSLKLNLQISEEFGSALGIIIGFVSAAISIAIAIVMDHHNKKKKLAICLLLSTSGIIFIFCTLITEGIVHIEGSHNFKEIISTLLVVGISLASASAPIVTEFCVDLLCPISEGTIGSWLTLWFNIIAFFFFIIFQIPGVGIRWLNFVLPISVLLPLPLIILVEEKYKRDRR